MRAVGLRSGLDLVRNADGSVGTRNILAITTTVQCVAGVLDFAFGLYRVHPTQGADFEAQNPRPKKPPVLTAIIDWIDWYPWPRICSRTSW
mgnify:CR=1 FL=1